MSVKSKKQIGSESSLIAENAANSARIPWPEWTDADLNNEKWAFPKNGADGLFFDAQGVTIPSSLQPHEWVRAKNLKDLTEPLTVYTPGTEYPDLITNNKHILHSEFVRWFVSALINLQYHGRNGLEISGQSASFVWNERYQPWAGWMHVYSMNKAGKGAHHKPTINPNGKYVARLHFMGRWRCVAVDDTIPVDKGGEPLLPRTADNSELWPALLAKALLKLASLTWTERREVVDFHPVASLTGWTCLALNVAHLPTQDKWRFLGKYAEHFEWAAGESNSETQEDVKSKNPTKKGKDGAMKTVVPEKPQPVTLFANLQDTREATADTVPGLSPCWSHFIYIVQSRDVPLDPRDMKPPLARWKFHRWVNWAIERKLLDPVDYFVPIRCLKIVSPLKEYNEHLVDARNETSVGREELLASEKEKQIGELVQRAQDHVATPESRQTKPTEDSAADLSFWGDFNKMSPYLNEIHLFYNLEYFQYTAQLSDRLSSRPSPLRDEKHSPTKKRTNKAESRRSSRRNSARTELAEPAEEFTSSYCWPRLMKRSRNEPLYLLCDSVESKFFLINFCTFHESSLVPNSAASDRRYGYLIVERHNWFFRSATAEPLVSISSRNGGSKSTVFELDAGRHLLRIYCRPETNCFVTISSDTIFHLGDRRRMHELMSREAERVDHVSRNISNAINNAFRSFGTIDYAQSLRAFYRSYAPSSQPDVKKSDAYLLKQTHVYFVEELVHLIKRRFAADEARDLLRALRVFFLDPKIGLERLSAISEILKALRATASSRSGTRYSTELDSRDSISVEEERNSHDRAATKLQAFFRTAAMKRYRELHDPAHPEHATILERLSRISELFDYRERESLANLLIRNLIKRHDKYREVYAFADDFQHVLQVQECNGLVMHGKPDQWIPVVRIVVNTREPESVLAAIDLFVELPVYTLRVFDNETGREVSRAVNNVTPARYRGSRSGYTVLGYGWSENERFKELPWTVRMVTVKGEPVFFQLDRSEPISSSTNLPSLMMEELSGTYVPNVKNRISKWVVRVATSSVMSLRLKASYELAQTKLTVLDEHARVLSEASGGSVVILPLVHLQHVESDSEKSERSATKDSQMISTRDDRYNTVRLADSNSSTEYFVEAFVTNDSWPLTQSEWAVASEAKSKVPVQFSRTHLLSVSSGRLTRARRGSRQSIDNARPLQHPYWILQVVTDADKPLEIRQDRTREREIAAMKDSWAAVDPKRPARGRSLRDAFMDEHALVLAASMLWGPQLSETSSAWPIVGEDDETRMEARMERTRTLKRPQSYRRYLPQADLAVYAAREQLADYRRVKTDEDEEILRNGRANDVDEARTRHASFLEQMDEAIGERTRKYERILRNHEEQFLKRRERLVQACEARKVYVESFKAEKGSGTSKGGKKEKKAMKA